MPHRRVRYACLSNRDQKFPAVADNVMQDSSNDVTMREICVIVRSDLDCR